MLVAYLLIVAGYLAELVDEGRLAALQYATAARNTLATLQKTRVQHMDDDLKAKAVTLEGEERLQAEAEFVTKVR